MNKSVNYAMISRLTDGKEVPCTKVRMDNIVFPKLEEMGILGMFFCQKIKTKEQPNGCEYDEEMFQVVMRIVNGKLRIEHDKKMLTDSYAWKISKVVQQIEKGKARPMGLYSGEALINFSEVLNSIKDEEEKKKFADKVWQTGNLGMLLVTTDEEPRICIEVTQELYDQGLKFVVDEWMADDAPTTDLNVGDFLIKSSDGYYCIRRAEFLETHIIG